MFYNKQNFHLNFNDNFNDSSNFLFYGKPGNCFDLKPQNYI